jgi:outer membrane lipoprotein-sorting protein/peroxiredoxin
MKLTSYSGMVVAALATAPTVSVFADATPAIDPQARALLDKAAALYLSTSSYSDTTTLSATADRPTPPDLNFTAKIKWERPGNVAVDKTNTANELARAVSDGTTDWAVDPAHKGYYVQHPVYSVSIDEPMNEIGVGCPGFMITLGGKGTDTFISQGLTSLTMDPDTTVDGVAVHSVSGTLAFPGGGSAKMTILIGIKDGCVHYVSQDYSGQQGSMRIVETHSDIHLNPSFPAGTFTFVPPPNAKEIANFSELNPDQFKPVSLSDFKGQALIIHFFAAWEATAADVPQVVSLYNKYKDKGLRVVGVSMDERRELVTKLVATDGVPYPVLFDSHGWKNEVAVLYGVKSLPTTLLVGRDGTLYRIAGRPKEENFEEAITAALAK